MNINDGRRKKPRGTRLLPLACLLAAGSLIGLSANLSKLVSAADVQPLTFLVWSIGGAGFILTGVALAFGQRPALHCRTIEYFLIAGLLSVALPNAMFFYAVNHVGVGFVALSFAFPPLYTYALALLGRLERPTVLRATGVGLGVVGALIIAHAKWAEADAHVIGIGLALGAPIIIAAGNIYRSLRWPTGASSVALAPGMLIGALLFLLAGLFATGQSVALPVENGVALLLIVVQAISFAAMYMLYFILQRLSGPVYMSQVGSVGAIVGAAMAVLVLGETPPAALPVAALFTAIAVFLVTRAGSNPRRPGVAVSRTATAQTAD